MNDQLLGRVLQSSRLPSLPAVAMEVVELVQRPDVDLREIARTIQHDPALASKILKTVNSSAFGQVQPVTSVGHAVVVLGLNSVKTLALGFSLTANLKALGGDGFDQMLFWKRSLYSAAATKQLAQDVGLVGEEEAFLGALLQDLGMLALHEVLGLEYASLIGQAGADHAAQVAIEREQLGLDHCQVGAALAESWRLPPLLVAPIRDHGQVDAADGRGEADDGGDHADAEDTPEASDATRALVRAVCVGNRVADLLTEPDVEGDIEAVCEYAHRLVGLDQEQVVRLLEQTYDQGQAMRRLLDLPTGELEHPGAILARANEALLQLNLQSQQQNRQLTEQATTDSLTATANRRRFNEFVSESFDRARARKSPLSVLFADIDHFKHFNDTYGHATGDCVLVEVADRLKQLTPENGLVCRYGGEEFAIVVPDLTRRDAAMLAEHMREAIEKLVVTSGESEELSVTVSVGVATYEGAFFERIEQLVKAADKGVYAAKHAGRNCVRVFAPRPQRAPAA